MLDLDRKIGPVRLRTWGLVANFLFNAIALLGLSGLLTGSGGVVPLVVGVLGTLACITVLAIPSKG